MSNDSCAVDGRFDKQVEELLNKFYEMVEKFCNTKPLPRRLEDGVVAELHRVLEKLYDLLIEPFSQSAMFTHLDPKATIVFVPDKVCDAFSISSTLQFMPSCRLRTETYIKRKRNLDRLVADICIFPRQIRRFESLEHSNNL